jgi:hypothetical protein
LPLDYPDVGITTNYCVIPIWSWITQCSTIFPVGTREMSTPDTLEGVHQNVVRMLADRRIDVEGLATSLFERLRLNTDETAAILAPGATRGSRTLSGTLAGKVLCQIFVVYP